MFLFGVWAFWHPDFGVFGWKPVNVYLAPEGREGGGFEIFGHINSRKIYILIFTSTIFNSKLHDESMMQILIWPRVCERVCAIDSQVNKRYVCCS